MIVVDASIALKWVLLEEYSAQARQLASEPMAAPGILLAECANTLWVKQRRGDLSEEEARARLRLLRQAPIEQVETSDLVQEALELAIRLDLTVYDALYLAVAADRDAMLVTADRRLAEKALRDPQHGSRVWLLGEERPEG